ncbi:MAG TPA: hypothetical protein PLV18_06240, partial [Bacteroidales bacterium]|nr:hypothetical protein [Bacteroidales bacterium]
FSNSSTKTPLFVDGMVFFSNSSTKTPLFVDGNLVLAIYPQKQPFLWMDLWLRQIYLEKLTISDFN